MAAYPPGDGDAPLILLVFAIARMLAWRARRSTARGSVTHRLSTCAARTVAAVFAVGVVGLARLFQ